MRKAALEVFTFAVLVPLASTSLHPAPAGFQKVSPHFFYLESKTGTANTGAVVTTEGVLLIDPPPEAEIPALQNALKVLTTRAVRWVVHTDYKQATAGGWATFLEQGAAIIGSRELDRLAGATHPPEPNQPTPAAPTLPNPRFLFGQQLHLWPAGIEIRILAVKSKARTAGDIVVFLPSEKILATGDLFSPFGFPAIDRGTGEGSARGWIDGLRQVIEFVPLLKSAMPQPKQEPQVPVEPEKTLEETVIVMPGHGPASNMQQMKSLLSAAQKLRTEASRAVAAGRMRDDFVKSLPMDVYGEFSNLETFAGQLFDELSKK
jgi:glyoxylase-like metal-dependent hydrolase (beta-lactamase superfamily II)